jgi:hypothetical protein
MWSKRVGGRKVGESCGLPRGQQSRECTAAARDRGLEENHSGNGVEKTEGTTKGWRESILTT